MLRRPFESALCALVGMMDHPGGPPLRQRHVQCFEHQLGAQMSLHRPAHDPAAEGVEHDREIGVTPVKWTAEGLRLTPLSSGSFRS